MILLKVSYFKEVIFVELPNITRMEPTILKNFCSKLGVFIVTNHYVWPFYQYLTILGNFHFNIIQQWPNKTKLSKIPKKNMIFSKLKGFFILLFGFQINFFRRGFSPAFNLRNRDILQIMKSRLVFNYFCQPQQSIGQFNN